MARFRLKTAHFIEPELYPADTVIDYSGPVNPGMEPLDEEAQAMMDEYIKAHPAATINPVMDLPKTMATAVVVPPKAPDVPKAVAPKAGGK